MGNKIGFIGLGKMGLPIAHNLIATGYHLQVYNRTTAKADELTQDAITICKTPAEAASNVEVVITMLTDDDTVKDVVCGENGILKTLQKGGVHISMSTISPNISQELAHLHVNAGNSYVTAPVFGRPEAAAAKKLWICTSGDEAAKNIAKPILNCLGQDVIDFGTDAGSANVIKIVGNFMSISTVEIMAEALALAERNGLDRAQVANFFGSTMFNAPVYQNYGRLIAEKRFQPVGFKTKLGYKDTGLAFSLAEQSNLPLPVCATIHNRMLTAVNKGWGERDCIETICRGVADDE